MFTKEVNVFNAIHCAILHVKLVINELKLLRKPEYTSFVVRVGNDAEEKDGYERIYFYKQVLKALKSKLK